MSKTAKLEPLMPRFTRQRTMSMADNPFESRRTKGLKGIKDSFPEITIPKVIVASILDPRLAYQLQNTNEIH